MIKQVTAPYKMQPVDEWFTVSIEPLIGTRNRMTRWRPFINDAVRQNPKSVEEWATSGELKAEAGLALTETGHLEEALKMFEAALAARPDNSDVLWNTAMLSGHFGRIDEARKLLERFVSLHPNDGRVEKARELLRESERAAPTDPGD
jgi:tetratricopeptide (TPR) repeat protein